MPRAASLCLALLPMSRDIVHTAAGHGEHKVRCMRDVKRLVLRLVWIALSSESGKGWVCARSHKALIWVALRPKTQLWSWRLVRAIDYEDHCLAWEGDTSPNRVTASCGNARQKCFGRSIPSRWHAGWQPLYGELHFGLDTAQRRTLLVFVDSAAVCRDRGYAGLSDSSPYSFAVPVNF
ncbi:hypothetical protein C8R48DRAFT_687759 [Suillus tomentosus]|nr:hypothetical protein C8R48DRAFT_687759 [Suillus tomentosus]